MYFEGYLTPICQIYKFGLLIKFINLTLIVNSHETIKWDVQSNIEVEFAMDFYIFLKIWVQILVKILS